MDTDLQISAGPSSEGDGQQYYHHARLQTAMAASDRLLPSTAKSVSLPGDFQSQKIVFLIFLRRLAVYVLRHETRFYRLR